MLRTSCPQYQQPFENNKTIAQLVSEPRKVIRITHDRSDPVDASYAKLEKDIVAFLIDTVPSSKPLDETLFMVTFNGKIYTANFPESLLPPIAARKNFLLSKNGARHIFNINVVDTLRKGTAHVADDNFATVKIHADEIAPDDVIRETITARFANIGLTVLEGKEGLNIKRPMVHVNFKIKDPGAINRSAFKSLHAITFNSVAMCWLSKRFCEEWNICNRCLGTNGSRDRHPGCTGRCELHDKKRKIAQVSAPPATFGDASTADF